MIDDQSRGPRGDSIFVEPTVSAKHFFSELNNPKKFKGRPFLAYQQGASRELESFLELMAICVKPLTEHTWSELEEHLTKVLEDLHKRTLEEREQAIKGNLCSISKTNEYSLTICRWNHPGYDAGRF